MIDNVVRVTYNDVSFEYNNEIAATLRTIGLNVVDYCIHKIDQYHKNYGYSKGELVLELMNTLDGELCVQPYIRR